MPSVSMSGMLIQPVGDPRYSAASAAFQKAFWMQIGVTQTIDKYQSVLQQEAEKKAYRFYDKFIPLNREKFFFIVGTAYSLGVKQEIAGTFNDPFIRAATHTIKANPTGGSLDITIPFN